MNHGNPETRPDWASRTDRTDRTDRTEAEALTEASFCRHRYVAMAVPFIVSIGAIIMANPNYKPCTAKPNAPAAVKAVTQYSVGSDPQPNQRTPGNPNNPGNQNHPDNANNPGNQNHPDNANRTGITLYDASNNVVQTCDQSFLDANFNCQ